MPDKPKMKSVLHFALLPVGLAIAFLAFVNAASGIGALPFAAAGRPGWLGINGHILSEMSDRDFKAELANHQAQSPLSDLPQLSDKLITEAKAAYAVNPLDVASLRTIALGGILQEDKVRARELMRTAVKMSRRDTVANLWLAEDYGQLGDTDAMLASFDHLLRTNVAVRQAAMKPMVETLAKPTSFRPFARLLKLHPEWEDRFWLELARNPTGMANAAAFLQASGIPLKDVPQDDRMNLYANLKRAKLYDSLFELAALDPDIKPNSASLASGHFVTVSQGDPLGWTLHSTGTSAAYVSRASGVLEIDAQPGSFGIAAERIAAMSGRQELTIQLADAVPDNAALKLTAKCANGAESLLAEISLRQGQTGGQASFDSADCAYSNLILSFSINEGRRGAIMRIARVALTKT